MSCREAQELIHGYVDGELDLVRNLEMERHFRECTACAGAYERLRGMRSAMNIPYFQPPVGLETRIRARVREASGVAKPVAPRARFQWQWAGIAAGLVIVALGTWRVATVQQGRGGADTLAQEVLASHVRSLMASHLTDVPSSDRHTVKPWFNGKLDFSPVVGDFVDRGFPLLGGRLDYLGDRPVAALVYQRRKHVINLFIWPAPQQPDTDVQETERQGYHLMHWTKGHMTYWAASDLNPAELRGLVGLVEGS
jgi:anti-sigma factor RsiW